jgi:hypothetical protein
MSDYQLLHYMRENETGIFERNHWNEKDEEKYLFAYGNPSNIMRVPDKTVLQRQEYFTTPFFRHPFNTNLDFAIRNKWINPEQVLKFFSPYEHRDVYFLVLSWLTVQKDNKDILDYILKYKSKNNLLFESILDYQYHPFVQKRKLEIEGKQVEDEIIYDEHNRIKKEFENDFNNKKESKTIKVFEVLYYIENIYFLISEEKERICSEYELSEFLKDKYKSYNDYYTISKLRNVAQLSSLSKKFLLGLLELPLWHVSADPLHLQAFFYNYLDCGGNFVRLFKAHEHFLPYGISNPFLNVLLVVVNAPNWEKLRPEIKQDILLFINYHSEELKSQDFILEHLNSDLLKTVQFYLFSQSNYQNPSAKELYKSMIDYFLENESNVKSLSSFFDVFQFKHMFYPSYQQASVCSFANHQYSPEKYDLPNTRNVFNLYCHAFPSYVPSQKQQFLASYLELWTQKDRIETQERKAPHILTFIQQNKISSLSEIIEAWVKHPIKHEKILKEWQEMMKGMKTPETETEYLVHDCLSFVEFIFISLLKNKSKIESTKKRDREEEKKEENTIISKRHKSSSFSSSSSSSSSF